MKKTIAGLALIMLAAFSVHAQQTDQPTHRMQQHGRHHGGEKFTRALNLSAEQQQQMKELQTSFRQKMADLKKHDEISVKEYNAKLQELRTERKEKMQAVLTPAQKETLAKMKQERQEKAKERALVGAEKLKAKLKLTDAQASQLKDMRAGTMTKIKSIREDNALSHEQKKEQIKGLVMQQKEQLKTILSAEQLQQMEQMKAQHHRRDFSK